MGNLFKMGRIFYGLAVAETGLQIIYYHDFPYWFAPPKHSWIPGIAVIAVVLGIFLVATGACIILEKKTRPASLLLGGVMLSIFCFCFVPYELIAGAKFLSLLPSENALKELAVATGAFVVAAHYSETQTNPLIKFLAKLIPSGAILFAFTMICFGMAHLLYAIQVKDYVPTWVPYPLFWTYLAGIGLVASGVAIIIKIQVRLATTLLGGMTLTWFIILHIPRIIMSPIPYLGSEVTSAILAFAYSGIAFAIAGASKK
jgi:uncharacterized membrane protein